MPIMVTAHIYLDERGVAWIDDTNVKVIEVVLDKHAYGWSPEETHLQHPHLSLAQIYAALARLCWGEVHGVIGGLQRMQPTDAQAAAAIGTRIRSLQPHQQRVDYRVARKGGDPMGSSGMESANTFICHVRLKRSGAWWDCDQRESDARPALRQIPWHL